MCLEWVANKRIVSIKDLEFVNASEYIGGLSDFTGEIGRLAVIAATSRDMLVLEEIHQVDVVLSLMLTKLNSTNRFSKKLDMLNTNLKKVEQLIFELKMSMRSGRKNISINLDNGNGVDHGKTTDNNDD